LTLGAGPFFPLSGRLVAQDATNAPFYFVQITDTHLGDRDSDGRTRQVVDAINNGRLGYRTCYLP
jgi:hypothetical protein